MYHICRRFGRRFLSLPAWLAHKLFHTRIIVVSNFYSSVIWINLFSYGWKKNRVDRESCLLVMTSSFPCSNVSVGFVHSPCRYKSSAACSRYFFLVSFDWSYLLLIFMRTHYLVFLSINSFDIILILTTEYFYHNDPFLFFFFFFSSIDRLCVG